MRALPCAEKRERVKRAFLAGIIDSEREELGEYDRIDAGLSAIEAHINDLLGRPIIAAALEGGLDLQTWTPGRRRSFLKLLIDAVIVDEWPAGTARTRRISRMSLMRSTPKHVKRA